MSVNNSQKSAPASCTKKSAQKIFLFYRKNLRFQNFLAFYRKIFRAENILGRIKPWIQTHQQKKITVF